MIRIVKIYYASPDVGAIKQVARIIRRGGLAIVPGDAVYTLVGDATNIEAIAKINRIKKRKKGKAFNLGLYSLDDIDIYGISNPAIEKVQTAFPDEPFTFVVERREGVLPGFLNPGYKKLGFRVPFNKVTSTLSSFNRTPVIGTSANISGMPDTHDVEELMKYFRRTFGEEIYPEIILNAGALPDRRPSTVIDVSGPVINIIRPGEIDEDSFNKKIKDIFNESIGDRHDIS